MQLFSPLICEHEIGLQVNWVRQRDLVGQQLGLLWALGFGSSPKPGLEGDPASSEREERYAVPPLSLTANALSPMLGCRESWVCIVWVQILVMRSNYSAHAVFSVWLQ